MYFRPLTYVLGVFVVLTAQPSAQGQPSIREPDKASAGSSINPVHERSKIAAEQAYQRGDFQEAIRLASKVLQENSEDHVAYYLRASARVEQGRATGNRNLIRSGIQDARETIRIAKDDKAMYYLPYLYGMTSLAMVEQRDSHAKAAVDVAGQIIGKSGLESEDKANLLYQRAMAYMFMEDYAAAQRDFSQAVRLSPSHLGAHVGLADAYAAADEKEKALAAFTQAVKTFPDSPLVHNNRGMYLQQLGNHETAIKEFSKTIELDREFYVAYMNRGYSLMQQGQPQAALEDFNKSLQLDQNQATGYNLRGSAYLAIGDARSAVRDYTKAIQLDKDNPVAYADLGFAKYFAQDYKGALQAFNRALDLDPRMRYLDPWRCLSMFRVGNTAEAQKEFRATLRRSARQRDWIDNLLAFQMGRITADELLAEIDRSKNEIRSEQLCEAHFFIGLQKAQSGEQTEAAQHFQKARETQARHLSAYRGALFGLNEVSGPQSAKAGNPDAVK